MLKCVVMCGYIDMTMLMKLLCRYHSTSSGEREIQRTMLELLNQLDGFDSRGDVKVSAIVFLPVYVG